MFLLVCSLLLCLIFPTTCAMLHDDDDPPASNYTDEQIAEFEEKKRLSLDYYNKACAALEKYKTTNAFTDYLDIWDNLNHATTTVPRCVEIELFKKLMAAEDEFIKKNPAPQNPWGLHMPIKKEEASK